MSRFALKTPAVIKGLFAPSLFCGLFGLLLLVGCTSSTPQTRQQPTTPSSEAQLTPKEEDRTMSSLDVQLMPEEAGIVLLNPSPVDGRLYVTGITVTIDVIPEPGWVVAEWKGPVFEIFGDTAYVTMDGNKSVVVRLDQTPSSESPSPTKDPFGNQMGVTLEEPTAVPTATAVPTPTIIPTPTPGPYPRASAYREAENWSMAVREYSEVIEADPDDGDAYYYRAYSYHQIGNHWQAISDYDKALELNPSSVAYNNRGDVYRDMGRYQQAIDDYTDAIRLDRNYAEAYNGRAIAEKSQGANSDWTEGQACLLDTRYCPTPTPIPTQEPTIAPTPKPYGMQLSVNDIPLKANQAVFNITGGSLVFDPAPDGSGKYDQGTTITATALPTVAGSGVHFGGLRTRNGNTGTIVASGTSWSMTATITSPYGPYDPVLPSSPRITFLTQWGSGGSSDGEFDSPWDIAVARDDSVYVADALNHRIQKFTSEGVFVSKWSTSGAGDGQFNQPWGIEVAPDGSVYVADSGNHRIQKFTSEGVFVSKWGSEGTSDEEFDFPYGVAVATDGSVYVADSFNNRIQKFTSEGVFVSKWGTEGTGDGEFKEGWDVAVAPDGSVYVADYGNHRVQKFTSEGVFVSKWGTPGSGDGLFNSASGITVASDGSVYVSDYNNNRIQKFTSEGVFVNSWGTSGDGDGEFGATLGNVAVTTDGRIYVLDTAANRIQKFSEAP